MTQWHRRISSHNNNNNNYDQDDDDDEEDWLDPVDPKQLEYMSPVTPPDILNVHRWSFEEDLALLKAVPILGNM